MNSNPTKRESEHLAMVKSLPCSVCDLPPPSEAHHIDQSCVWTTAAICVSCHRDGHNGWHGRRAMWKVRKMLEIDALGVTVRRLMGVL